VVVGFMSTGRIKRGHGNNMTSRLNETEVKMLVSGPHLEESHDFAVAVSSSFEALFPPPSFYA
jgi:hypothetical protein